MSDIDFDELSKLVLANPVARVAAAENAVRRSIGEALKDRVKELGQSVRGLAKMMGTSPSQAQRLLHEDVGGSLTLTTICRAADSLGLTVFVQLSPKAVPVVAGVEWQLDEVSMPSRTSLDPITSYAHASQVRTKAWSNATGSKDRSQAA